MMINTETEKEETKVSEKTPKKFFVETYGCQMNVSDSEIVISLLQKDGYISAASPEDADIVLINTCAIRENAEERVRTRIRDFKTAKKHNPELIIGVLGCMAERLKTKLLEEEQLVDMVVGPDAYRSLPQLINKIEEGEKAVNVLLSLEETYSNINPVRFSGNGITAFITIMRGCDNMCSFCVVPFTRGRERSRDPESIVNEAKLLFEQGYREVTLLGQNVDSYKWFGGGPKKDFEKVLTENKDLETVSFANLLEQVALISPLLRIRFSTSNPQDMTDEVLHVIAKYHNICKYIHLPMQSGSSRVLEMMNRGYNREKYLERINAIRTLIPGCGLSTDVIAGFCSETDEDHKETISLMEAVRFDYAYMFPYSERPATPAAKKYKDDVPEDIKLKRMQEILAMQRQHSMTGNKADIGKEFEVLVEGYSKRSKEQVFGRNTQNKAIIFTSDKHKPGDYVNVRVTNCTSGTLIGEVLPQTPNGV
ncbi:MAG TPA: tRNA (N6-isopentenyl adenosine(37)-C2)-methylthiotransferase MiaB [Bacteroidia bacterium]|nr:tRNA (N6-isopentenyl adenosine(37)-C2)-methylthiotransferase MiaB [Bacteroidia bacterium]